MWIGCFFTQASAPVCLQCCTASQRMPCRGVRRVEQKCTIHMHCQGLCPKLADVQGDLLMCWLLTKVTPCSANWAELGSSQLEVQRLQHGCSLPMAPAPATMMTYCIRSSGLQQS